jgi:hypothetical protein
MFQQQTHAPTSAVPSLINKTDLENLVDLYFRLSDRQRQERFLDTHEVAAKFSLSQRTVQHWINLNLIAAVLVGKKKYKVDLHSVEAFLRERAQQREVI